MAVANFSVLVEKHREENNVEGYIRDETHTVEQEFKMTLRFDLLCESVILWDEEWISGQKKRRKKLIEK